MESRVNGQEAMDFFINDLVATFQLTSPTILYNNNDDMPDICFDSPWVLCLSIVQKESVHRDEGIDVPYLVLTVNVVILTFVQNMSRPCPVCLKFDQFITLSKLNKTKDTKQKYIFYRYL